MIRMCPICTLDVHDYRGSGKLRHHNDGEGARCPGSATRTTNLSGWEMRRDAPTPSGAGDETTSGAPDA